MTASKRLIWSLISILFLSFIIYHQSLDDWLFGGHSSETSYMGADFVPTPYFKYGFNLDSVYIEEDEFEPNEFFSEILLRSGISYQRIHELAQSSKDVFSVRKFRSGKPYALIRKEACAPPSFFIYEPNPYRYIIFPLDSSDRQVEICERPVNQRTRTASGTIDHSLWVSMKRTGYSSALIAKMEDALGWSVDFYHIQKGDSYKLIFEEEFIDGESVGIGRLQAAYFNQNGEEHYSIWYENDKYAGYYDLEGRPMKRAFLKSPVRYARISSRYNRNRYHPILKRRRPHLGTDYAADYGTPIRAVAEGRVSIASYTRGNGNYVKIRHDEVYETQYLHMSRFAKGIRAGAHVDQGQTIGYVGATGLATGPHVCFRFWKNGRQVDHLRQNLPPPDPMPKEELPKYLDSKDYWVRQLNSIGVEKQVMEKQSKRSTNP